MPVSALMSREFRAFETTADQEDQGRLIKQVNPLDLTVYQDPDPSPATNPTTCSNQAFLASERTKVPPVGKYGKYLKHYVEHEALSSSQDGRN